MKLKITVETDKYADVPWPQEVPLPAAGDQVILNHGGEILSITVDLCVFDFSVGPAQAHVRIRGHHATAGSV
ncbi:MAG: hypothetical protein WDO68_19835 [Gammaproteobacteria bacterium]